MKTLLAPSASRPPTRPNAVHPSGIPPLRTGEILGAAASSGELCDIREADLNRVLQRLAAVGTTVRVARYTLVKSGQDPTDRLVETQGVINPRGWQTSITTFDSTDLTDPALRPQMARLVNAIRDGEIHGIVAVSRVDVSAFQDTYTDALAVIRAHGGFLALVRNESTI